MNKEDLTARVTNASPLELLKLNFELAVSYLREADAALASGDSGAFMNCTEGARGYLRLLQTSLDMEYGISRELMRIYIYINGLILKAEASKSAEPVLAAADMLFKLSESFYAIDEMEAGAEPAARDNPPVYAGLTYRDGKLSEYVDERADRGFKA